MKGFQLITPDNQTITFSYYTEEAPVTCAAFDRLLPFALTLMHARTSGQEFWSDKAPLADIIQENASVFTETGEAVFGPAKPARVKTSGCIGFYYGEGKGLDAANIFAKVNPGDQEKLKALGEHIWKKGEVKIRFEKT